MELMGFVPIIVVLILIGMRIRMHFKNCMWYFDDIDKCWVTQCKNRKFTVGINKDEKLWNDCIFCGKPIAVNPFIQRSEGRA